MLNAPKNVKSVHIYNKNISFPIVIYSCSEWDDTQISYLNQNIKKGGFTTYMISKWCKSHQISYQILFPDNKLKLLFRDPRRFVCFLYLIKNKA